MKKEPIVSPIAKLSPRDVRRMRRLYASGRTQKALAEDFRVSQSTVSNAVRGKIYRRVA